MDIAYNGLSNHNIRMSYMSKQQGFTLIEIAIVLVIIGLLIGGVLKGQEMITQAKIRNVANDFNGVSAAYYSYQDRYRAIPGDDVNAATRWTTSASGDGNGVVGGSYNDTNAEASATEAQRFWQHLRLAGLVAGQTTGDSSVIPPTNASGGLTGVQNGALGLGGLVICVSNLPAKIASAIDSQFDDGIAKTGQVRGVAQAAGVSNPTVAAGDTPSDAYVDDGTTLYTVCKNI
jgi:prepilin-type N-terminal cleavage/methylation domain-containing protein